MRQVLIGLVALASVGLVAGPGFAQRGLPQLAANRNGWLGDYQQGKDLARKSGKPMMLVFRCVP